LRIGIDDHPRSAENTNEYQTWMKNVAWLLLRSKMIGFLIASAE